jgi:hypothetical protein
MFKDFAILGRGTKSDDFMNQIRIGDGGFGLVVVEIVHTYIMYTNTCVGRKIKNKIKNSTNVRHHDELITYIPGIQS